MFLPLLCALSLYAYMTYSPVIKYLSNKNLIKHIVINYYLLLIIVIKVYFRNLNLIVFQVDLVTDTIC